ncbi:MAG: hypothetical protein IPL39_03650 [Opitutaceae bacterium]|nr:hypothetical protein [Opitutaceae bacterium]
MPARPSPQRTLVYFGHVPAEGAGSAIIVYRHLQRFAAAGWQVRVVADWGQEHLLATCVAHGWPTMTLSHRRRFWPPLNPDRRLSRACRAWLWGGEVRAWLGATKPSAVFTYLSAFSDMLSIAAVGFARRYRLPLATIIHDDARDFLKDPGEGRRAHDRRQWIVESSTRAWFASPGLAESFQLDTSVAGVLPPIPEGAAAAPLPDAATSATTAPLLVYAGNYWPPQLPVLAALARTTAQAGGRFLSVLKENPEHLAYLSVHHVAHRPPFARNTEALDYFRAHAAAMVVSYAPTSDDMPWTRTSFPSKLIEYCHLGLPLVIVAPADTAIVRWARERAFPDVFDPADQAGFAGYVARLQDPAFRRHRAEISLSFARGEFDPAFIQQQLSDSLTSHV